ncbi:MAG: flagellin [Cyanobacteria bacterium P01_H01_bin.74]
MPLTINTNVSSLNAQRYLSNNTRSLQKTMEKLASGFRINRAGDDAAGLQLSENLRSQIRGAQKALDNTLDGLNVLNIADGALQISVDNLQRMRELAIQAASDTYNGTQRAAIQVEVEQLLADIDRIALATEFNGVDLLSAATPANFILQVGANTVVGVDTIDVVTTLGDARANTLGITTWNGTALTANIDSAANARNFINLVDTALTALNTRRGRLGAMVNRLEGTSSNLSISVENLSSSESRIRNVDVALESANLTRNQILQQASNTVLAQANQTPQLALQLLQG